MGGVPKLSKELTISVISVVKPCETYGFSVNLKGFSVRPLLNRWLGGFDAETMKGGRRDWQQTRDILRPSTAAMSGIFA